MMGGGAGQVRQKRRRDMKKKDLEEDIVFTGQKTRLWYLEPL